jgi:hypothetical protein
MDLYIALTFPAVLCKRTRTTVIDLRRKTVVPDPGAIASDRRKHQVPNNNVSAVANLYYILPVHTAPVLSPYEIEIIYSTITHAPAPAPENVPHTHAHAFHAHAHAHANTHAHTHSIPLPLLGRPLLAPKQSRNRRVLACI